MIWIRNKVEWGHKVNKGEPEIVKFLREEERLGKLHSKLQSNCKELEILDKPLEKTSDNVINVIKNDTGRKIEYSELDGLEEKYKTIFETSAVAITLTDENERIILWNKYTENLLGMNKNDLYMKPVELLYPPEEWRRIRSENVRQKGMQHHLETKMIGKNNELIDVDISLSVLKNHKGRVIGSVGVVRDITQRKMMELELQIAHEKLEQRVKERTAEILKSNELLKQEINERKKAEWNLKIKDSAIASSINAIVFVDPTGDVTYVNPSFLNMWGYDSEKEILGRPAVKFWHRKGLYVEVMEATFDKGGWVGELVAEKSDGALFDAQLSANVVKDEEKNPICMMASFIDITARKKIEEKFRKSQMKIEQQNIQLKKLDKLKSNFLNITSHELRTPMCSMKGYVQMLLKKTLGDITEEQKRGLMVILRNVDRLDNLIRDILDISRLESGTMKFITGITDIHKMIGEVAETMRSSADLKHVQINEEIEGKLPELVIDQERIKQVLINLVNNAIKFSPDSTVITIRAKKEEENVLFEVQDFGRGIPRDKQKKIFETFYQVDYNMDRTFGGAGLGLAISRGIVLAHGGEIWVESKPGKGSTFGFTLPVKSVKDVEDRFKEVDVFMVETGNGAKENNLRMGEYVNNEEEERENE
jgi:PAS domain S-box-containing protein